MSNKTKIIFFSLLSITLISSIFIIILILIPQFNTMMHYKNGVDYLYKKNYQQAIQEFNNILKVDTNNILAINSLGLTYIRLKKYKEAIEQFNKTLKLEPTNEFSLLNLGVAYFYLNKRKESSKYFEMYFKISKKPDTEIGTMITLLNIK